MRMYETSEPGPEPDCYEAIVRTADFAIKRGWIYGRDEVLQNTREKVYSFGGFAYDEIDACLEVFKARDAERPGRLLAPETRPEA